MVSNRGSYDTPPGNTASPLMHPLNWLVRHRSAPRLQIAMYSCRLIRASSKMIDLRCRYQPSKKCEGDRLMNEPSSIVYLVLHGETARSLTGQYVGLTHCCNRCARNLGKRLNGLTFARVFASPLQRATETCRLAGIGAAAEVDPNLVEWDTGEYEGLCTAEIHVSVRIGNFFATAAREVKPPTELGPALTA
jgi:hypothetical protein